MRANLTTFMALRYALGRFGGARGNGATGATSVGSLALAGLIISIAVLVFVMSVVNGFERELRERLLNVLPHVTATSQGGIRQPVGGFNGLGEQQRSGGIVANRAQQWVDCRQR